MNLLKFRKALPLICMAALVQDWSVCLALPIFPFSVQYCYDNSIEVRYTQPQGSLVPSMLFPPQLRLTAVHGGEKRSEKAWEANYSQCLDHYQALLPKLSL